MSNLNRLEILRLNSILILSFTNDKIISLCIFNYEVQENFVLSVQNHFKTDKLIHYTQCSIVAAKLRQTRSLFRSMFHKCVYHKS